MEKVIVAKIFDPYDNHIILGVFKTVGGAKKKLSAIKLPIVEPETDIGDHPEGIYIELEWFDIEA